jgi:two-component system sensor histidine kinase TorS
MNRLFNAFSQVGSDEAKVGGTGLGLAISQKIITALEGVLDVESQPGSGSRFWFSVPLSRTEAPEQKIEEISGETSYRAKVFMVEDNPVNCMVAEGFLKLAGHEVTIAEDGATAEALFRENSFDIALLDINLPDCNGVELMHRLKGIEKAGDKMSIPYVAISAHVFNEEVENYLASGFDAYISKPINQEQLMQSIQHCLSGQTLLLEQPSEQEQQAWQKNEVELINRDGVTEDRGLLGEEKYRDLALLFYTSSYEIVAAIELAANAKAATELKQLAHKLKGSAGSMGMTRLNRLCYRIESSDNPLDCYLEHKRELQKVLSDSIAELKAFLDS